MKVKVKVKVNIETSPHMGVDGLCEGPVPVIDHAVDLWLDEQLCPLTSLQLGGGGQLYLTFVKRYDQHDNLQPTVKADLQWNLTADTSITCFLLDLSLEAHSTAPPRRSTVNSGFDWLLPNFWHQGNRWWHNRKALLKEDLKTFKIFSNNVLYEFLLSVVLVGAGSLCKVIWTLHWYKLIFSIMLQ